MLCGMLLDNKTTCKSLVSSALINMNNIINKFLLAGHKFMPDKLINLCLWPFY